MLLYSSVINVMSTMIDGLGAIVPKGHSRKFFRFVRGQRHIIDHVRSTFRPDRTKPTVWIHAASFGEYSVARPLITEMKRRGMLTVVTFFSPSGYEAVAPKHPDVDFVYYLPFDTRSNARKFLDIIRPDRAVFIVSEYWFNYLDLLRRRNIPTYLVSAKITSDSVFFKWYGKLYRKCLPAYKRIFAIDQPSIDRLSSLGYDAASTMGNPLFDNAIEKAATPWSDPKICRFADGHKVFIAGSIHDENDLKMVTDLANRHPDIKFLMVPHETGPKSTAAIKALLHNGAVAYSEVDESTDLSSAQSLIIDFVGSLAYIYRYAQWAYVGGGFTPYLHSLLEATVYGLPVAFGPVLRRKVTPRQIADLGIGCIVHDSDELDRWFISLKHDDEKVSHINAMARHYVAENAGSTQNIVNEILK